MSKKRSTAILEVAIYGGLLFVAIAIFWATLDLPASRREPLGSSSIPQAVSALVAIFCVVLLGRAAKALLREERGAPLRARPAPDAEGGSDYRRRYDMAAGAFVLAVAFAILLQERWLMSEILIPAFLGIGILMLNGFRRRAVLPSLLIAVGLGLATSYAFKTFFYIDLP